MSSIMVKIVHDKYQKEVLDNGSYSDSRDENYSSAADSEEELWDEYEDEPYEQVSAPTV